MSQRKRASYLNGVLTSSRFPLAALGTLQQEELALAATTESINALQRAGLKEDDAILKQLLKRQAAQQKRATQLKAGAPSVATQKEAHALAAQTLKEKQHC